MIHNAENAAPGYYIDRTDGEGDLFACAACVNEHGLSTAAPVSAETLAWAPLGCGIHTYGANPKDYVNK